MPVKDDRKRTKHLGLVLNRIGDPFPEHVGPNQWGDLLNAELEAIDKALADVCSPDQLAEIRALLRPDGSKPGLIL